jgi:hypothetical protein
MGMEEELSQFPIKLVYKCIVREVAIAGARSNPNATILFEFPHDWSCDEIAEFRQALIQTVKMMEEEKEE